MTARAFALLLLCCSCACRQNPDDVEGAGPGRLPYDLALARMAAADSFNGSVIVALPDTVFEQTYRAASAPEGMHAGSNYRYPIGEVAHVLLRAAFFRMADQGRLNLNTAVGKYLPELPRADVINYRMLLDHRGGVPSVLPKGPTRVSDIELISEPGTVARFSPIGYDLLAAALARMTGTSPAEVIRTQVLEPAGMAGTGVLDFADPPGVLAAGYSDITGQLAPVSTDDFDEAFDVRDDRGALQGLPEYYSTIADLFYLAQYLPESAYLKGELEQPGVRPGYRSYFYADVDGDLVAVALSNDESVSLTETGAILRAPHQ